MSEMDASGNTTDAWFAGGRSLPTSASTTYSYIYRIIF
jgi:hypothetical protein